MSNCRGLILAGGLSTRMGSDKAALRRNHQTMKDFSRALLSALGLDVVVAGGASGIPDLIPGAGPLAAIYSVLHTIKPSALLVLPVDMPLLTTTVLGVLLEEGEKAGVPVCYEGCYLPLYLPVTQSLRDYLDMAFTEGSDQPRSLKRMLAALNGRQLPITDTDALLNANTPEEWQRVVRMLDDVD
ncbi:molybdenum cofactor guanylyltransferase [Porticoccus hydrocarbonoclasticus]|jgi:molybdopterin-guanine dinucleotide biosynthesis protein A|uniref:molybdenum cofactor guanylyltransferase n=1 Tax=Porticoccus hydrocarbonoclasticus TaxID=1073414 RepID=UPI002352B6CE|nr:molybdenum cofactor guanylyltransferase [Porticoccus hydrocarbonoclasticus]